MRRAAAAMALCLILSGCSAGVGNTKDTALEIRREYTEAERVELIYDLTADYGSRVYHFRLCYSGDEENGTVEVLEPENVAGVKVKLEKGQTAIGYGDEYLATGELTEGLSPLEAAVSLLTSWQSGYIESCCAEQVDGEKTVMMTVDATKPESGTGIKHRTWFDEHSHLPVKAEIYANGEMVISCSFCSAEIG